MLEGLKEVEKELSDLNNYILNGHKRFTPVLKKTVRLPIPTSEHQEI
jgi:hypothetical protein